MMMLVVLLLLMLLLVVLMLVVCVSCFALAIDGGQRVLVQLQGVPREACVQIQSRVAVVGVVPAATVAKACMVVGTVVLLLVAALT